MEYHNSIYILLIALSVFFAARTAKTAVKRNKPVWTIAPFYMLLVTFTFIVGTRYFVGNDYGTYMSIVIDGDAHHYYDNIEFMNRLLVDLTNNLGLEFYWWFIIMAFIQIFFLAIAVKDSYRKIFPWIVYCFFLLYITFYMSGIRQGAALSCFICAATFIKERKLYHYLAFVFIGSLFHSSILFWLPIYWIVNKNLFDNVKLQYIILFASMLILPHLIEKIFYMSKSIWWLVGYEDKVETFDFDDGTVEIGSGLGLIFRYLRWIIIIAYYNKLKELIGKEDFTPIYNIFFIAAVLDCATFRINLLTRVVMYGAIFEIFVLASLFYYMTRTKNTSDRTILLLLLFLQTFLSFMSLFTGSFKWHTIWDRLYIG